MFDYDCISCLGHYAGPSCGGRAAAQHQRLEQQRRRVPHARRQGRPLSTIDRGFCFGKSGKNKSAKGSLEK